MASILRSTTARATAALFFMAATTNALSTPVYQGCYSVSTPLKEQGTYQYQTSGWCQSQCAPSNQAVLGLSNANECWCGNEVPPLSTKVDDSSCNTPCDGYDSDMCGGQGFWSVYSTGLTDSVQHYSGSVSTVSSSSPSSSVGTTTSSATPSVITKVSGTTVIVVTQQPTATANTSPQTQSSKGSVNTAGIAAGVVVAVVVITGAIAGLFIWLRYRKRREAEEEYKRAQVAELARSAERKPPPTSWSATSDSRLEPTLDRRNSFGSIADNEDYSRKILRVANPDRSTAFQSERPSIFPPDRSSNWPPHRV